MEVTLQFYAPSTLQLVKEPCYTRNKRLTVEETGII